MSIFSRKKPSKPAPPTFDDIVKDGLDCKGQSQSYQVLRYKDGSLSIGVDLGDLVAPGLATLTVNAKGGRYQKDGNDVKIDKPILFASLYGTIWSVSGGIDAEASVGYADDKKFTQSVFGSEQEILAASLEVKAGASASFDAGARFLFMTDYYPQFYSFDEIRTKLRPDFEARLKAATQANKDRLRETACLITGKKNGFFSRSSTDDVINALGRIVRLEDQRPTEMLEPARALLLDLQNYRKRFPLERGALLRLVGGNVGGAGKAGASAKVELTAPGLNASVEAEASLLDCSGSRARTSFRLQLPCEGASALVLTQDTVIDYVQLDLSALKVSGSATFKEKSRSGEKKKALKALNTMRYWSASTYWHEAEVSTGITPRPGSGLSFGQAVTLDTLWSCLEVKGGAVTVGTSAAATAAVGALARGLRVKVEDLTRFLQESAFLVDDLHNNGAANGSPSSVLIEAGWRHKDPGPVAFKPFKQGGGGEPDKDLLKKLKAELKAQTGDPDKDRFVLDSIRLRYRKADTIHNEKTIFNLGFELVLNLGISLKNVEDIGSEGVVDLCTVWFNDRLAEEQAGTASNAIYEGAVPAVILLHQ